MQETQTRTSAWLLRTWATSLSLRVCVCVCVCVSVSLNLPLISPPHPTLTPLDFSPIAASSGSFPYPHPGEDPCYSPSQLPVPLSSQQLLCFVIIHLLVWLID